MKISIITVCYNSAATIEQCVQSVLNQTYKDIEYIVVDGNSTDGTQDIIKKYESNNLKFISEKDNGIYDAMNKGVKMATGDIVGILNSDDFYASNEVLEFIVSQFKNNDIEGLSTDVAIYKNEDFDHPYRYYSATKWRKWMFRIGWQLPHPGFFVKKSCYDRVGLFDTQFRISADFDLLLRMVYKAKIRMKYVSFLSVKMRDGGASAGIKNMSKANKEDNISLIKNGYFSWLPFIWLKYPFKAMQLFLKK